MHSNLNYRHVQVHADELHRDAAQHRLAASARAPRRIKPKREFALHVPNPISGIAWMIGRLTAAVRAVGRA
jgi:hypothetical protein